jgi:two-component system sensor histidine kinase KdpD
VITGAGCSLLEESALPDATRRELASTIVDEATRLNRLVGDLLDATRLESGAVRVNLQWHSLEEVVGAVLARTERLAADRRVTFQAPAEPPLVKIDDVLYAQAVTNLVENALHYTPAGSPVELTASIAADRLVLEVRDHGHGLPAGGETQVFEKFWRGDARRGRADAGLGLTIARAIASAHGGRLVAANHPQGGAVFRFEVPSGGEPHEVESEAHEGRA